MSGEISIQNSSLDTVQISKSRKDSSVSSNSSGSESVASMPKDSLDCKCIKSIIPNRPHFAPKTNRCSAITEHLSDKDLKLVWSDEFDGPNGSAPDPARWTYDVGGSGFGNHELEYYTTRPENAAIKDGNLVITARKEKYTGPDGVTCNYTSARLLSSNLFSQKYGRIESRIKIPEGQGMWPACWMLGQNIGDVGWPDCGEIDIMENVGNEPSTVHGTVHGPGYSGANGIGAPYKLPNGKKFSDDYHVFGVDWAPDSIKFYVDGDVYHTVTPDSLPKGSKWVFDKPFFMLLNLAVGGDWPGSPDATTKFPQKMKVDWIRVYEG